MLKVKLIWEKVLMAEQFDANKDFLNKNGGLYLWILRGRVPRVIYVGETFRFSQRFIDHFCKHLGGRYLVLNPIWTTDFLDFLKWHFDGKIIEELYNEEVIFCPILNVGREQSFTDMFLNKELIDLRLENLKRLEFAFATLECKDKIDDKAKLRKQIEGVLITELMRKYRKISGSRLKLKNAGNFCRCVIGDVSRMPDTDVEITHEGMFDRIPDEVTEITSYAV